MNPPASPLWYVYLLLCGDGTLYCGIATDPDRRLRQHNGIIPGGARYTRARRPCRLLASVPCSGRSDALRLEAFIKTLPRARKLDALLGTPHWGSAPNPAGAPAPDPGWGE